MMKEKIEILIYNQVDEDFSNLIQLHQLIFKINKLDNLLIYFDNNFPFFLKKIVEESTSDFIFTLKINDILEGFIHLKIFEDVLFLNHICLGEKFQGKGYGKMFLLETLSLLNNKNLKYFSLDVFKSNEVAFSWYTHLGLKEERVTMWKQLLFNNELHTRSSEDLLSEKDVNNFESLFFMGNKVATVINKSSLIIHDLSITNLISFNKYIVITNQDTQHFEDKNFKIVDLETSARMKGSLITVLNKLKN